MSGGNKRSASAADMKSPIRIEAPHPPATPNTSKPNSFTDSELQSNNTFNTFNGTQLNLLFNAIRTQRLELGQLVHVLPSLFFQKLSKNVHYGDSVPAIVDYSPIEAYFQGNDVVDNLVRADLRNPNGFIVIGAAVFKKLKDCFHLMPATSAEAQYPITKLNPEDEPLPDWQVAEIDIAPVTLKVYSMPANEQETSLDIRASTKWTRRVLESQVFRAFSLKVTSGKKLILWNLNSDGAGFGSAAHVEEEVDTLGHWDPINADSEGKDRVYVVGVEVSDQDLDDELPDSSDIATNEARQRVSFEIKKETAKEKRERVKRLQSGIDLSDEPNENRAPLQLGAADPFDSSIVRIPASGRTVGSTVPTVNVHAPKPVATPGAMGLNNLGNTCFMNSALQCLSNSAHLTSYFLSDQWKQEVNADNPLGMNGEVARAYAGLVRQLWNPNSAFSDSTDSWRNSGNSVAPRNFKSTIGRFNQTFLGYNQQDSQELLQFLLDGLHEDLNRILKKPYVEQPEMDGRPDGEIATKSWEIYRMRNDSQIVDLFQGSYKSRVECLDCGKWSVKFDPYMFLSLPVPERREVSVEVVVVGSCFTRRSAAVASLSSSFLATDGDAVTLRKDLSLSSAAERLLHVNDNISRSVSDASLAGVLESPHPASNANYEQPKKLSLTLPRDATILSLKQKVAEKMGMKLSKSRRLVVSEVFSHKIYKSLNDWDRVSEFSQNDVIYVHEVVDVDLREFGDVAEAVGAKTTYIPVYLAVSDETGGGTASYNKYAYKKEPSYFGVPLLIPVPAEMKVHASVAAEVAPYLTDRMWNDMLMSQLGSALYELVVKSLGRYSKIGLYQSAAGSESMDMDSSDVANVSGTELIDEFAANSRTPKWSPGQPPAATQPASPWSEVEDDENKIKISPNTAAVVGVSLASENPVSVDPRSGGLFSHLVSGSDTSLDKTSVKNLFRLKYMQGEKEVGLNSKAGFYYSPSGWKTESNYFDLSEEGVSARLYRKRSGSKLSEADGTEENGEYIADAVPVEQDISNDYGDVAVASVSDKNLESHGFFLDPNVSGFAVRHVSISQGGKGKGGSDEPVSQTMSLDGELLIVAEFTADAAKMIFGDDLWETNGYGSKAGAVFEPTVDLTPPTDGKKMGSAKLEKTKAIALDDCLKEFMKEEIMGDEDTWYCPNCKEHKKIKKKLDIWSVPDVLVLHLKRFSQTGRGFRSMSSSKIDALVDFPVTGLDLSEFVIGKEWMREREKKDGNEEDLLLYDLFAVSNHFGGMGGGHYTAYAKNSLDDTWYNFDDSHVSKLSESSNVVTPAAYMLFYQRRRTKNTHKLQEMVELRKNAPPEPEPATTFRYSNTSKYFDSASASTLSNYSSPFPFSGLGRSLRDRSPASSVGTAGGKSDDESFIGPKVPDIPPSINHATIQSSAGYEFGGYKFEPAVTGTANSSPNVGGVYYDNIPDLEDMGEDEPTSIQPLEFDSSYYDEVKDA